MVDAGDVPWPNSAASARAFSPASPSSKSPNTGEGEIPAGENAELLTTISSLNNKEVSEPIPVSSRNKLVRYSQTGNSSTKPNRKFHTYKKNCSKALRTKQLPFKSSNNRTLSWHKDDNLVIRFSDDDSGTDTRDSKSVASMEKNDHAARLIKFKMPMSSSQRQQILQQSTQHGPRFMSKKGVAGSMFSSVGKINGSSSSEKVEHIQKQIAALKLL